MVRWAVRRGGPAGLAWLAMSGPAHAHAFGQRYDLPLPLWMFIAAAAAAVALSFVMVAVFVRHDASRDDYPRANLLAVPGLRLLAHPVLLFVVRLVFVLVFALVVVAGFIGAQNPQENLAVVTVWVIAWVGLAFICALAGNFWALVNPWNALFKWAELAFGRATGGAALARGRAYPAWLGTWPAFAVFFIFAWMEIVWTGASVPHNVAVTLAVYSAITWFGMYFYGREMWLRHGEAFTVVFTLFARFAIFEVRVRDADACRDCAIYDRRDEAGGCVNAYGAFFRAPAAAREVNLRPPGVGLRGGAPPSASLVAFVLLLLATVTFDGFTETETWQTNARTAFDALSAAGLASESAAALVDLAGVVAFPLAFVVVYLAFIVLIGAASESMAHFAVLAPLFVFSIVPIAIAYHLSHYISLLAIEGQLVIAGASDPLGRGWDLFGTAAYRPDITAIGARFVWFFSVFAIVTGHIVAVWLAHREALEFYDSRRRALESQVPMLALMLGYTMVSLWIIAQPIVG